MKNDPYLNHPAYYMKCPPCPSLS